MERGNTIWIPISNERPVPQNHQFWKHDLMINESAFFLFYISAIQEDEIRINYEGKSNQISI